MKNVYEFYGHSDDLFCMDLNGVSKEECYSGQYYVLKSEDGSEILRVMASYDGVWCVGVAPYDEDYEIPENYEFSYSLYQNRYSSVLKIVTPENVKWFVEGVARNNWPFV